MPDPESLAEEAAREFACAASDSIRDNGLLRVALAGGSTPRALYRRLTQAPYRTGIDWGRVRFFWGDERCVAPDNDRSNYRMARETLLGPLAIPREHIERMRGEQEPRRAALLYERALVEKAGGRGRMPRLDLVLLGLGADGHTASLFPGTRALAQRRRAVSANYVPAFREWRLTLTYPVFNAARRVIFLVAGEEKRAPASKILKRERGYRQLPASGIRPGRGALLWLLDEAAGRDL